MFRMQHVALAAAVLAAFVAVRAQDTDAVNLIKSAEQAVRHARYAEADALYAKAASMGDRPEIAPALLYLGVRALGTANPLAAEGFFERILKVDPKGPQAGPALSWLANMRPEDPARAESLYKQALALENPKSIEAVETLRKYATFLRGQGRAQEATALEDQAREAQAGTRNVQGAALPAGVYRMGTGITAPVLVSKSEPQYTEEARAAKIHGTVLLSVDIAPDGVAQNIEVSRSLEPGLDQKAIEAVRQWRFKPGMKDGAPVTVRANIEVNFRLM
jgi:TonB family protein